MGCEMETAGCQMREWVLLAVVFRDLQLPARHEDGISN